MLLVDKRRVQRQLPQQGQRAQDGEPVGVHVVEQAEHVVPGHGAITDKAGVRELRDYLTTLRDAARARYDAGLSWIDAAEEIVADHFTHWIDRERVFINVNGLYREFSGRKKPVSVMKVYEAMADWYWRWTSPAGCARRRIPRRSGSCVIPTGVARTSTS